MMGLLDRAGDLESTWKRLHADDPFSWNLPGTIAENYALLGYTGFVPFKRASAADAFSLGWIRRDRSNGQGFTANRL
jgi:hypothetical protein